MSIAVVGRIVPRFTVLATALVGLLTSVPLWRDHSEDLRSFLHSGRALLDGAPPYAPAGYWPNLNPPLSLPLFAALAPFDWGVVAWAWWCGSLGCMLGSAWALCRHEPRRLWLLAPLAGVWCALYWGQIYGWLLPCGVGAWLLARRHPVAAGLLLGVLVAWKPPYALWPLLLVLAGHRRVGLWAFGTAGVLSLLPLAVLPPSIYLDWLAATRRPPLDYLTEPINLSIWALATRAGLAALGPLLAALLVGVAALWAWRTRPDPQRAASVALCLALLASPIAWLTYVVLAAPVLVWLPWRRAVVVAALWSFPPYVVWIVPRVLLPGLAGSGVTGVLFDPALWGVAGAVVALASLRAAREPAVEPGPHQDAHEGWALAGDGVSSRTAHDTALAAASRGMPASPPSRGE